MERMLKARMFMVLSIGMYGDQVLESGRWRLRGSPERGRACSYLYVVFLPLPPQLSGYPDAPAAGESRENTLYLPEEVTNSPTVPASVALLQ